MKPFEDKLKNETQQQWDIFIEGFATAGEAEQAGLKIALGFLWAAVSGQYSIRLIYHTPLPCLVYDRIKPKGGIFATITATLSVIKGIGNIIDLLNGIISSSAPIDQKLLVACELFASARLETTERSKFIGLVSSLEPLAIQRNFENDELYELIEIFKQQLRQSNIDERIKESLMGQLGLLKRESVSMAIKRLVSETISDDPSAIELIDEAYYLRSKILHEGSTDADIELKSREIEKIVRKIFEEKIKQYLS
jgi:hypothetical protein